MFNEECFKTWHSWGRRGIYKIPHGHGIYENTPWQSSQWETSIYYWGIVNAVMPFNIHETLMYAETWYYTLIVHNYQSNNKAGVSIAF